MLQRILTVSPRVLIGCCAGIVLVGAAACAQGAPAPPSEALGPGCVADGFPQTMLPREKLTIQTSRGPARFDVQVAADDDSRSTGLMFVRKMPADQGMLFDFQASRPVAFWMHNTYIPLDLLFVQADGRILSIARNAPTCNDGSIPSGGPVRTVIELNAGVADKYGIRPGDRVVSEKIYPAR